MAFFEDGSVCTYFRSEWLPPLLAVGWLERGHEYAIGDADQEVLIRLREFQRGAWTGWQPVLLLGTHGCDFCDGASGSMIKNLFIPGKGVTYVAPEGIVHYVSHHRYLPPSDFCSALRASPPVNSLEYFSRLHESGWPKETATLKRQPPNQRLHPTALQKFASRFVKRRG
jgi:hypothetical protein